MIEHIKTDLAECLRIEAALTTDPHTRTRLQAYIAEAEKLTHPQPVTPASAGIDFPQVGFAGPFPIVEGRIRLPDETMADLIRHARTGYVPVTPSDEVAAMDSIVAAFNAWPADIRKKLSLHDLRRMTGWQPPVTPAGGEVEPVGFVLVGKDGWGVWPDTFCVGEPQDDETDEAEWTPVYFHPPVADAALPRGHRVDDGKQLALVRDAERYRWLIEQHRVQEIIDFQLGIDPDTTAEYGTAIDAALNQRGGGRG